MRRLLPALGFVMLATPALASVGAAPSTPWGLLWMGFAVGLAHALDADHVTAVAAMMGRGEGPGRAIARGAAWGLGHTLSLFLICSVVLALGLTISGTIEAGMEFAVGALIVALGLRVLWKLHRDRVHIHAHDHGDNRHLHAHAHAGDPADHKVSPHDHRHRRQRARELAPTLGVGLVHGAAGSAGLLVMIVAAAPTAMQAIMAFAVFGLGSMAGMMTLTTAASFPLRLIHRGDAWIRGALSLAVGGFALAVGGGVMADSFVILQAAAF